MEKKIFEIFSEFFFLKLVKNTFCTYTAPPHPWPCTSDFLKSRHVMYLSRVWFYRIKLSGKKKIFALEVQRSPCDDAYIHKYYEIRKLSFNILKKCARNIPVGVLESWGNLLLKKKNFFSKSRKFVNFFLWFLREILGKTAVFSAFFYGPKLQRRSKNIQRFPEHLKNCCKNQVSKQKLQKKNLKIQKLKSWIVKLFQVRSFWRV